MPIISHQTPALCLLAASWLLSAPAGAAGIDDAGAAALQSQLHDWAAGLTGPAMPIGEDALAVTAQGDHFGLTIALTGPLGHSGAAVTAAPITAELRPLDAGRWQVGNIRLPSPVTLTTPMTQGGGPATSIFTLESQDQHAVVDPSLATVTVVDGTFGGYAVTTRQPSGETRTRVEHVVSHLAWQPSDDGRGALSQISDLELLTVNAVPRDIGPVSLSAARGQVVARVASLAPDRITALLRALFDAAPEAFAVASEAKQAGHRKLSPATRAAVRTMLLTTQDLASGFDEKLTLEDVRVQTAAFGGHLTSMATGLGADASGGKLNLKMTVVLDGISSPELPAGVIRDYLPRHVSLSPRVSGLPSADVMALLLRAVDSDDSDPALRDKFEAALHHAPITLGLDDLALDFGPATLKGQGELQVRGRQTFSGQAHLTATGLDTLIRRASSVPMLQQLVPGLIFLKGFGQQNGDSVVWDITYRDGKTIVNGNDLSQMLPGK